MSEIPVDVKEALRQAVQEAAAVINGTPERMRAALATSRPVSAQDGAAGVDRRGGQGQDGLGRLTGMEEGR